jgi:hypothetical protein
MFLLKIGVVVGNIKREYVFDGSVLLGQFLGELGKRVRVKARGLLHA